MCQHSLWNVTELLYVITVLGIRWWLLDFGIATKKQFICISPSLAFTVFTGNWILLPSLILSKAMEAHPSKSSLTVIAFYKNWNYFCCPLMYVCSFTNVFSQLNWNGVMCNIVNLLFLTKSLNNCDWFTLHLYAFQCLSSLLSCSLPKWFYLVISLLRNYIPSKEYWADSTVKFPNSIPVCLQ